MSGELSLARRDLGRAFWSVVYTRPHCEIRACTHLNNQGFRWFLPLVRKTVRHARTFHSRATPLFPRYLFVELVIGRDQWTRIRGTFGVAHLMMDGEMPRAVPEGIVEALLKMADPGGFVCLDSTLQPGEMVRIVDGPFAGLVGKLASLDPNGRVRVLLDVLGTQISVTSTRVGLVPAA